MKTFIKAMLGITTCVVIIRLTQLIVVKIKEHAQESYLVKDID